MGLHKVRDYSVLSWGCYRFDSGLKKHRRIGNVKAVRIGTTRSKKQKTINANDDIYEMEYALAA
jgi:hypothetical protein